MCLLLTGAPAAAALPPVAALQVVVVIRATVAATETQRYAELRQRTRESDA
jgi:hypothetical protein